MKKIKIAAFIFALAGITYAGIPVPHRSPNGVILPSAINCDGTNTLEIDGSTLLVDCANNSVSHGGASTFVGSTTLKAVSRIEDTLTLASDARGDISWNASEVILDGNAGYGFALAANGQGSAIRASVTGEVGISSGAYASTITMNGAWNTQVNANDVGITFSNAATSNILWRTIRDSSSDDNIVQMFSDNAVTIQLDTEGNSYFNSGSVGIGTASPIAGLHVSTNSSFTEPATYVSSVTFKTVGRIEDTLTLASDARGDISWNAAEVIIDGNAGYGVAIAGNGQAGGVRVGTDGKVSLSSGVFTSTMNMNGSWDFQIGANDVGLKLANASSGSLLWRVLRDAGNDDSVMQLFNDNAVTAQVDSDGVSYFNGGNVGINDSTPDDRLEIKAAAADNYIVRISSQDDTTTIYAVDKFGHHISSSATAATLGTCTNGAIDATRSNDYTGRINFTGANTSCAVVFAAAYKVAPNCWCSGNSAGSTCSVTETTTGLTIIPAVAFANTDVAKYWCVGVGQ